MTRTFDSLDDIRAAVGTDLGSSRWFELTQDRINGFADTTEDRQWIHVDPERAADGPFGSTVAHGFLTLALVAPIFEEIVRTPWATAGINYGLNKVRFPSPAPVGSRVRGHIRLLEVTDISGGIQLVSQVTIEREGADRPVCVAESVTRILA
ncbi:MaoC family dehydratase [Nocardia rhizosphaerihabitans]|uniref:MaoC family dehydratase n=1 Tax=Nocardia rhizosphaerihabitans TaxID=1691570 RepID=A0ABQ2L2V6_9NOCA|nr:MaoC family dehydratase [Nocardia rhizosphaerihabitans]GGO00637.1 MaoC family dehydratase [Nocardia rhizosphaerihabitans]